MSLPDDLVTTKEAKQQMSEYPTHAVPEPKGAGGAVLVVLVVVVAIAALLLWKGGYIGSSGSADRSSSIASKIGGGASCVATDYEMTNKLAGTKTRLYDCSGTNKGEICVTEEGGIVNDETAAARILFANTLGTNAPACAQ